MSLVLNKHTILLIHITICIIPSDLWSIMVLLVGHITKLCKVSDAKPPMYWDEEILSGAIDHLAQTTLSSHVTMNTEGAKQFLGKYACEDGILLDSSTDGTNCYYTSGL